MSGKEGPFRLKIVYTSSVHRYFVKIKFNKLKI